MNLLRFLGLVIRKIWLRVAVETAATGSVAVLLDLGLSKHGIYGPWNSVIGIGAALGLYALIMKPFQRFRRARLKRIR